MSTNGKGISAKQNMIAASVIRLHEAYYRSNSGVRFWKLPYWMICF